MIELRSLTMAEVAGQVIFSSHYTTSEYLDLRSAVNGLTQEWLLRPVRARKPFTRRLDAGGVDVLLDLYGPREGLRFIGAFDRSQLVGLVTWRHEAWNQTLLLCDIRIHEDHRRKGIAGRLLEDLRWEAMRLETRGIMLETQNTNYPAILFYVGQGFQLVGLNTHLYRNRPRNPPEVALFFFLPLD